MARPTLTIVIPCFNEAQGIHLLVSRLAEAIGAIALPGQEWVLVDDGSNDGTWAEILAASQQDNRVVGIRLSRNFGHQSALTAGLAAASGEYVAILDADLQDPPEAIPQMITQLQTTGADVVYGRRRLREGESVFKRASAAGFYRVLNAICDRPIPTDTGDFRVMTRRVTQAFVEMPEYFRFSRGMIAWLGFRQEAFLYDRAERTVGETKYPLGKMVRLAADAMVGFSFRPLRAATWLGVVCAAGCLAYGGYAAWLKLTGQTIQGWASVMIAILAVGSVQLICLGLIGEYLGRLVMESKRRPQFLVDEVARAGMVQRPDSPMPDRFKTALQSTWEQKPTCRVSR